MSYADWNEQTDPGGPAANRSEMGYEVRKGFLIVNGQSVVVGDQFTRQSDSTVCTVTAVALQWGGGGISNDNVTLTTVGAIPVATLIGGSWATGSFAPSYVSTKRTGPSPYGVQVPPIPGR
ncbi:MAG: hypothetical protein ACLP9L_22195 [Thermoguttaceae bacterium]